MKKFLFFILLAICFSVDAEDTSVNVSAGGEVGGSFCIGQHCIGGNFKLRIGVDSKTGIIKWQFEGGAGATTGASYSLSGDVSVGTGEFGEDGTGATAQGSVEYKDITITGTINSDGSYSGEAEISLKNGAFIKGSINGNDINAGVGIKTSSGNYQLISGSTGVQVNKSGTLYDPYSPPKSGWDIFWGAIFAPGMAIGEAVATTQIAVENIYNYLTKDNEKEENIDTKSSNDEDATGGMSYAPGESPAEQLFNPNKEEGSDDQCLIPDNDSEDEEDTPSGDDVTNGGASSDDDDTTNGDNVTGGEENSGNGNNTESADNVTNGGETDGDNGTPAGDDTSSPDSNGDSGNADDSQSGDVDWSSVGNLIKSAWDETAIVGPTIAHKRILWIFSGESLIPAIGDNIKGAFESLRGNRDYQSLESNIESLKGSLQ